MRRVVVIDEDPAFRALHQLVLEDLGLEVRAVADSESALRLIRSWNPDLAVLDLRIGGDFGLDLLRQIVELQPQLRTIIVSAHAGYKDDFASWLADAFLDKDTDCTELCRTVTELMDHAEPLLPC